MTIFIMADRKIVDDTHHITQMRGNCQLRREIWADAQAQVTRYKLAYITHALHAGDNGRVVGYVIAGRLHRDRSAVKRDVDQLARVGLVTIETNTLPGHGLMKEIRAAAGIFRLEAMVM